MAAKRGSNVASSTEGLDGEGFEPRHAVGLGPKPDLSRCLEGRVGGSDDLPAVKRDGEAVAFGPQRQAMPFAARHLGIRARELLASSFYDAVEAHVVLERVRPRH